MREEAVLAWGGEGRHQHDRRMTPEECDTSLNQTAEVRTMGNQHVNRNGLVGLGWECGRTEGRYVAGGENLLMTTG